MTKPYSEIKKDNYILRTFDIDILNEELVWHRDEKNRIIEIIENNNWKFQFDNEIPFLMKDSFEIKKGVYHRIIKGTGNLIIKITESDE